MPSLMSHLIRPMLEVTRSKLAKQDILTARKQAGDAANRPVRGVRIEPVDASGVPCEWMIPKNARADAVMMYIHGGGFVFPMGTLAKGMMAYLARTAHLRVFAPHYRLAPEHPFPAAMADCATAYRWLITEGGIDPSRVIFAGESAGGNLVVTTAIHLRDAGRPLPAALMLISPVFDLAGSATFRTLRDPMADPDFIFKMLEAYRGKFDAHHPLISPICADLRNLPPMYIQAGGSEMFRADAEALAECAKQAGVDVTLDVWPEMWHFWHLFAPTLPEARQAVDALAAKANHYLEKTGRDN